MRVLQYNIRRGGAGGADDPERLSRLRTWVEREAYDVVGLNELNGWTQSPGLYVCAKAWGYSSAELFVTPRSKYFVGVLAKSPIRVLDRIEEGFYHGVLHVVIREVHFIITHLNPKSAADRLIETKALVQLTRNVAAPVFIMGDLNTLSPLDQNQHDLEPLRKTDALRKKFLDPDGRINYEPMRRLLQAGLVDLCPDGGHTVPTSITDDKMHAVPMRLDYILANDAALRLLPRTRIVTGDVTAMLSDHYPVECRWD